MALNGLTGSSGLNFNNVNSTVYESIRTQETNLRQTLSTISTDADGNVSQADMLAMQQQISQWTMMVEVQSTISKSISDSLKSVIQKSSGARRAWRDAERPGMQNAGPFLGDPRRRGAPFPAVALHRLHEKRGMEGRGHRRTRRFARQAFDPGVGLVEQRFERAEQARGAAFDQRQRDLHVRLALGIEAGHRSPARLHEIGAGHELGASARIAGLGKRTRDQHLPSRAHVDELDHVTLVEDKLADPFGRRRQAGDTQGSSKF